MEILLWCFGYNKKRKQKCINKQQKRIIIFFFASDFHQPLKNGTTITAEKFEDLILKLWLKKWNFSIKKENLYLVKFFFDFYLLQKQTLKFFISLENRINFPSVFLLLHIHKFICCFVSSFWLSLNISIFFLVVL